MKKINVKQRVISILKKQSKTLVLLSMVMLLTLVFSCKKDSSKVIDEDYSGIYKGDVTINNDSQSQPLSIEIKKDNKGHYWNGTALYFNSNKVLKHTIDNSSNGVVIILEYNCSVVGNKLYWDDKSTISSSSGTFYGSSKGTLTKQ